MSQHNLSTANALTVHVGQCIYCRENNTTNLGKEHVIPLSLGGGLILLKASCPFHSKMTRHFETEIARGMWRPVRTIRGLPTRNKKERPTHFMGTLKAGDVERDIQVPVENFPDILPTFAFLDVAGALTGSDSKSSNVQGRVYTAEKENEKRAVGLPPGVLNVKGNMDFPSFVRLTAKIAHGIAILHNGFDFDPFLLDLIEGRIENLALVMGAAYKEFPPLNRANAHFYAHELAVDGDQTFILVSIGLFAGAGAPIHTVVAGAFDSSRPPKPSWTNAPNKAASAK